MKYILALDQGTTSSRAIVFDHEGCAVAQAQKEFAQHYPEPGWVEHDPMEIWATQSSVAVEAVMRAGLKVTDIGAIGITNQRETTVVWDRATGKPIYPAIVWQDRRTAPHTERLRAEKLEDIFRSKTGLVLDPYFSGTKLAWILDHVSGARERAERGELAFGTIDTWLLFKLTDGKVHATDASNASRTLMLNIHTGEWDDELLRLLNVPRAVLPQVLSSSEVYGQVASTEFLAGIPIAGMAGDQQAALFAQVCVSPGMAKNTYGTGCFLLTHTGTQPAVSKNHLLTTIAWKLGNQLEYALEGSVFIGGALIQWLRDGLGIIKTAEDSEILAAQVADTGGVYIVPAFSGLGAPYWDPHARGTIVGITRGTTSAHIARAALEAIAFESFDVLEAMDHDSGIALKELRVDGGASRNAILMQTQADILGVPVLRPKVTETTALGAAYLAGLAVGFWSSREDLAKHWQLDAVFKPQADRAQISTRIHNWRRALDRAKGWA
ncbi:MAG TPA: glycerol kinase GlpK [Opitutales bacterium]|nr:glycerol kinase GlpK [Opitutales bacterium]